MPWSFTKFLGDAWENDVNGSFDETIRLWMPNLCKVYLGAYLVAEHFEQLIVELGVVVYG